MPRAASRTTRLPRLGALLALLALLVGAAVPPGFMVASSGTSATMVICTGHGPAAMPGGAPAPDSKGGKAGHDSACPFAGHSVAAGPAPILVATAVAIVPFARALATVADLAPGRGLAAPPPPSHAPPLVLV